MNSIVTNSTLLLLGLKSLAVLVPAFALAWLIRRQASMSRHLVWRCAFLVLVTIPLWPLTSIEWQPSLPSTAILRKIAEPVTVHQTSQTIVARSIKTPRGGTFKSFQLQPASPSTEDKPLRIFVLLYLLGLSAVLLRLIVSAFAAMRIYRRSKPMENWELPDLMEQMGVEQVRLRSLHPDETLQSPVTLRWNGPVILVPQDFNDWPEEAQRIALLHELAHIRRGDWAVSSLGWFISACYWFNPLVWVALGHLRDEAERACDDEVLAIGVVPTVYAEELLQIATSLKAKSGHCFAVPMARHSQVEGRIAAILAKGRKRLRFSRKVAIQSALFTLFLALPLCAFSHFNDFHISAPSDGDGQKALRDYQRAHQDSETFDLPKDLVKANGFGATLPDGTTVRLTGISNRTTGLPQDFWTPTGGSVQTLAAALGPSEVIGAGSETEEPDTKMFGLSISRARDGDCSVYLADPITKDRMHLDQFARASQYLEHGSQFFLTSSLHFHGESTDRIYAGFGQGQWRMVETLAPPPSWSQPTKSMASIRFVQGRLEAQVGQGIVTVSVKAPREGEVRVRFLDPSGATVATAGPLLAFERNPAFEGLNVKAVQKLVIESRPLAWVDFSGIATHPNFVMAPTLRWGTATDTEGFKLGSIDGEVQGTVEYKQVHSLWRPSAILTPAGQAWSHYPSPKDADLEQQPKDGLVPHTVMLQFTEQASFNDRTKIDSSVEVQDGNASKWETPKVVNDQGSFAEAHNNINTRQIKRLTFYASPTCSRVRLTMRASDGPWVTTNRVPLDLSGPDIDPFIRISGDDRSSAVQINILGPNGPRSIPTTGALSSAVEDVRVELITRSGGVVMPMGASTSQSGYRDLTFQLNGADPKTGKTLKPSDIVAVEFQSRAYNLSKTLEFAIGG
jgi:beta-lactamase regulating signal transducer with metallopeptidase domain